MPSIVKLNPCKIQQKMQLKCDTKKWEILKKLVILYTNYK